MIRRLAFTRRADAQLAALEEHIAVKADRATAEEFVERILARCARISNLPLGGRARPDLGRSLRSIPFERSTTIVYRVRKEAIVISGIFYGGQELTRHYPASSG